MRKIIKEYAKTITKDTPIAEIAKIIENIKELEYLLKALEQKNE